MKKLTKAVLLTLIPTSAFPSVTLNFAWDPVAATNLSGYRVFQSKSSGVYNKASDKICDVRAPTTTCSTSIANDGTYYWVATAYDTLGNESDFSKEIYSTIDTVAPGVPINIKIVNVQPAPSPTPSPSPTPTPSPIPVPPVSFWSASSIPAKTAGAENAVELGIRFTSDVAGTITGIKFYKAAQNTGTHTGTLWTATGTVLARTTFTNETASGWQTAYFSTPVPISPNVTYVASYHNNVGYYSINETFFNSSFNVPPLHAPATTNGVYTYGTSSVFPTSVWNKSNYWVDVILKR